MGLNLDPGFDGDFSLAERAIRLGWIGAEDLERAILASEQTPGSRLLGHLPLTPEQLQQLATSRPAAVPPELARLAEDPSRRVGHFVLVEGLYSGGMSRVFKAWDLNLSRWVAMKFPRGAGLERPDAYFEREPGLAAGLSQPNIAAIYEVGRHEGASYIAMQFIPGRTLQDHPRAKIKADVGLIRDAARAVAFANSRGVIHRDLKPSNLMVTPEGHV